METKSKGLHIKTKVTINFMNTVSLKSFTFILAFSRFCFESSLLFPVNPLEKKVATHSRILA